MGIYFPPRGSGSYRAARLPGQVICTAEPLCYSRFPHNIMTRILSGQYPGLPGSGTAYAQRATKGKWLKFSLHVFLLYSPLHLYYSTNFAHSCVYINNAEVTVNTCTYTDVFTVITTKHQQRAITLYGFMASWYSSCLHSIRIYTYK